MEKETTTPEAYPRSLNALVAACNQKSSRDPIPPHRPSFASRRERPAMPSASPRPSNTRRAPAAAPNASSPSTMSPQSSPPCIASAHQHRRMKAAANPAAKPSPLPSPVVLTCSFLCPVAGEAHGVRIFHATPENETAPKTSLTTANFSLRTIWVCGWGGWCYWQQLFDPESLELMCRHDLPAAFVC